jgi:hypothetical protein
MWKHSGEVTIVTRIDYSKGVVYLSLAADQQLGFSLFLSSLSSLSQQVYSSLKMLCHANIMIVNIFLTNHKSDKIHHVLQYFMS